MTAIPPELLDFVTDWLAPRYKGKTIKFNLKPGQYMYRYFRDRRGAMHCYTPHPSTEGDYFAWTYQPYGKGARSKPNKWKVTRLVRCARAKTAKAKAIKRMEKVNASTQ